MDRAPTGPCQHENSYTRTAIAWPQFTTPCHHALSNTLAQYLSVRLEKLYHFILERQRSNHAQNGFYHRRVVLSSVTTAISLTAPVFCPRSFYSPPFIAMLSTQICIHNRSRVFLDDSDKSSAPVAFRGKCFVLIPSPPHRSKEYGLNVALHFVPDSSFVPLGE
jgi:hypothetical protein